MTTSNCKFDDWSPCFTYKYFSSSKVKRALIVKKVIINNIARPNTIYWNSYHDFTIPT